MSAAPPLDSPEPSRAPDASRASIHPSLLDSARKATQAEIGLLLLVVLAMFFAGLGRLPLIEPDEGRNAEVAREMLVRADWVTPHFDTLPYLDKPVALFWAVAASFKLMGLSEWAARFPSALAGLLTALLVWWLGRRMDAASGGVHAAIVFATAPLAFALARMATFDMLLTLLLTAAMTGYWLAEESGFQHARLDVLMFAAAAFATLTKGPVGFLLPLLSLVAYTAVQGKLRDLARLRWGLGLAVFFGIALPWFVAVSIRNPAFPRYAFWQESLLRFATGGAHRPGGVFYYIPIYLAGFFPWSLLVLFAVVRRLKTWKTLRLPSHKAAAFLACWAGVVFVFFTISRSKLPAYFLPAIPALSLLAGKIWERASKAYSARPPDCLTATFAALILVGLALMATGPAWEHIGSLRYLADRKVHPALRPLLSSALTYSGLLLVALGILGRNRLARAKGKPAPEVAFLLLAATMPLVVVRSLRPLAAYARTASSRALARAIAAGPERDLPVLGYYYFRTSLPFYLQRPIGLVTSDGDELTSNYVVSQFASVRTAARFTVTTPSGERTLPVLLDANELAHLARSGDVPLLVMARNSNVAGLAATVGELDPLWDAWQFSVWKVPGRGSFPRSVAQRTTRMPDTPPAS